MWEEYEAARYRRVELLEEAGRRRLTQRVRKAPQTLAAGKGGAQASWTRRSPSRPARRGGLYGRG